MRKTLSLLMFAAVLISPLAFSTEENTIRLVCNYTHTIDYHLQISGTTGEDLITVVYSKNGSAAIKKQDSGGEFSGVVNDEEIYGERSYHMQISKAHETFHETLLINRYTGSFKMTFGAEGKEGGLIHYGKCKQATDKLF